MAATFTAKNYTVTKTAGVGGIIAANATVSYGANLDVTITPDAGSYVSSVSYSVGGVTKTPSLVAGAGSVKTFSITSVTGNVTIIASFATVDKSTLINFIAAALLINAEPYQNSYKTAFNSALAGAISVKNNTAATISEVDSAITALTTAINNLTDEHKTTFSVTVSNTTNGTVSVDKSAPKYGETVNITATPNANYALYKIFVNGVQINGLAVKNISADITITVLFKSTIPAGVTSFKLTYAAVLGKTVSTVVMGDSATVDAALEAYGALVSDNQKYLGTEYQLLKQLKTHLLNLAAANAVSTLITNLVNDNSMAFVTATWNAKAAYDALTPDQQKLLSISAVNTLSNHLNAANAIYLHNVAEQAKFDYVNGLINNLFTSIGAGGYADVTAATEAYLPAKANFDSLTTVQQGQITHSTYLTTLKVAIDTANQTAANLVSNMISNLNVVTSSTAFDDAEVYKKAIIEAKNAYDALTAEQKGLISAVTKAKLDECFVSVSIVIEKPMPQEIDSTLAGGVTFTGISDTIADLTVGTPDDYSNTEATINIAINGGGGDSAMRTELLLALTPIDADGVDTQPEGKVKIRILLGSALAAISDTLSVVYSHDNQIYSVPCTIIFEGGNTYLEFETDRFSTFAIVSEVLGNNNYLSALSASGMSITPTFSRDTFSYSASVENSVDSTTISATTEDGNATVTGTGTIALDVGTKTYNIEVTAQNGSKQIYGITITRAAASTGGGSGTTGTPQESTVTSTVNNNSATVAVTVTGETSATGSTYAAITQNTASTLIANAKSAEALGQKAVVEINLSTTSGTKSAEISIPRSEFSKISSDTNADVKLKTGIGTVAFNAKAVETISGASAAGDIVIEIAAVNANTLSTEVRETVGDRPVYDFTVMAGSSQISSFGEGSAQISIPYTPKSGEDKNAIIVYYINDAGKLQTIRGAYNSETGEVVFTTTHFSKYAIGYRKVSFTDVASSAWYSSAVSFIAAREITTGTSEGVFSPDSSLTRGQFVVLMMRAYGIAPDTSPTNNFSDAGSTYYTGYLAAAKRLGISTGIGNNQYAPESSITRQDMFTLLYRALVILGEVPTKTTNAAMENFSDATQVSPYASTALDALIKGGIITGSEGRINPNGSSTRAEMAQVLYKLLLK